MFRILDGYPALFSYNSLHASSKFCRLVMIFANSLPPDQAQQNVQPDLDPSCFDTLVFLWKEYFAKSNVEIYLQTTKKS